MAIYVCGDLHGYIKIFKKIKSMLQPDDIVYFIGDAGDRGPESWECIKAIYEDPQFIYLKGNHEDMLVKACEKYIKDDFMWDYKTYNLCCSNGGTQTLLDWEKDPDRELWLKRLKNLPTWDAVGCNETCFVLSHAGFTPWTLEDTNECVIPDDYDLLWNRDHYFDDWNENEMDNSIIIIHGHTPILHLADDINFNKELTSGAFWYDKNHKACIDSGGFFTGEWILLNLDTLESIIVSLDK